MAKLVYGSLFFTTPVETPLAAATPVKALGTTTAGPLGDFTHINNRLTYTGLDTRDFELSADVSMTKAGGGATVGSVHFAKGGSILPGQKINRTLANTSDEGAVGVTGAVSLSTGQYVELFLEDVNGDDLTIQSGGMVIAVLG